MCKRIREIICYSINKKKSPKEVRHGKHILQSSRVIASEGGSSSKTNLIPYDGTPEIKNRDGQKYLYVRKRVGNWLTSSHVDAYSDEMSCISYCSAIPERHGNCANIFAV